MEKVIRDGKVAVLYSPGYGAGWYSWNPDYEQLLFHPKLVQLVEQNKKNEITEELIEDLMGNKYIYIGGLRDLTIKWLNEGTIFRIDEYDGHESIVTRDEDDWLIA